MPPFILSGTDLDLATTVAVARGAGPVTIAPDAEQAITAAAETVARIVTEGRRVYGVNTGFGALSTVAIARDDLPRLQINLLRSHAAGCGPRLPTEVVRAMLLLRANTLARGYSGVRVVVVSRLLEMLAQGIHPIVPQVGQSR